MRHGNAQGNTGMPNPVFPELFQAAWSRRGEAASGTHPCATFVGSGAGGWSSEGPCGCRQSDCMARARVRKTAAAERWLSMVAHWLWIVLGDETSHPVPNTNLCYCWGPHPRYSQDDQWFCVSFLTCDFLPPPLCPWTLKKIFPMLSHSGQKLGLLCDPQMPALEDIWAISYFKYE